MRFYRCFISVYRPKQYFISNMNGVSKTRQIAKEHTRISVKMPQKS
jgi:hypothetical protein